MYTFKYAMPKHIAPGLMSIMPCSSMVLMSSHKTHYFRRPYGPLLLWSLFLSFLVLKQAAWTLCSHEGELFWVNYPFNFKPRSKVWMLKTSWQPEVSHLENSPSPSSSYQPEPRHLSGPALLRLLKGTLSDTGVRLWKKTPHCQARSAIAVIVSDHWFRGGLEPEAENAPSILLSIRKLQNDPPLTPV